MVDIKKVNPKRIILFGHSLGCSVTAYLMNYILENKKEKSNIMIIQNPFENIKKVSLEHVPFFGNYVVSKLKTDKYIKNIDRLSNNLNICIIHAKYDEIINYNHSVNLSKYLINNKPRLFIIYGTHERIKYNESIFNHISNINKICNKIHID